MGSIVPVGTTAPMVPIHSNLDGYTRLTVNPMGNTGMVKYRVYVYDTNFPDDGDTVTWLLNSVNMTSVKENATKPIRLFPNPAQDWLSLSLSHHEINTLSILNTFGQVVQRHTVNNINNLVINISELPKGIYTIQAENHQGYVNAQQFIKQ